MITLRTWPVRRRLRLVRRQPKRVTRRDRAGAARVPRFRLALVWRRRRAAPPALGERQPAMIVQVNNRLHVLLAWSAELRFLLERVVKALPRHGRVVRILKRLGSTTTLRLAPQRGR